MPTVPYKYLKDEHNTTFYLMVGPASFSDALPVSRGGTGATRKSAKPKARTTGTNTPRNEQKPLLRLVKWVFSHLLDVYCGNRRITYF